MSKRSNVVPISEGARWIDPSEFSIFVGDSQLRLQISPDGGATAVGPARLIDFPASLFEKPLANQEQGSDGCSDHQEWSSGEALPMKTFCIDGDHRISLLAAGSGTSGTEGHLCFRSAAELSGIVKEWPAAQLVEAWNALPGVLPLRKFTNRQVAVGRIWKAVQNLEPVEKKAAGAPKRKNAGQDKGRKPAAQDQREKPVSGEGTSKKDQVLALLRAPNGATLTQLMEATGWQKHSIRGFLSGTVHKKLGWQVASSKTAGGERVYRISA